MTMPRFRLFFFFLISCGLLLADAHTVQADAFFDFEANAPNIATPFTNTVNGLSATFGGQASVCDSFGILQSLSGNVLIQNFCGPATETGPLSLSFSADLNRIGFDFATSGGASTVTLAAFEDGTAVGSVVFSSSLPPGFLSGEGMASFAGMFNRLTLTGDTPLAIDNINAQSAMAPVPEPSMLGFASIGLGVFTVFLGRRHKHEPC